MRNSILFHILFTYILSLLVLQQLHRNEITVWYGYLSNTDLGFNGFEYPCTSSRIGYYKLFDKFFILLFIN